MMNARSLTKFLLVSALCGASNGFAPQASPTNALSTAAASKSPSALNVWNPFLKNEAIVEEVFVKEDPTPGPLDTKNYAAAAVWAALVGFTFLVAPGDFQSASDKELLELLISQPTPRPESINQYFYAVWNCFAVVPALIGALEAPVGRGQRLPSTPFLAGSAAFGYFALGPYFATRTVRTEPVDVEDLGFASNNIFESKIFAGLMSVVALSIPFTSDLFTCDPSTTLAGFTDLLSTSKFIAVSCVDIAVVSVLLGFLVSEDATRRGWEDKSLALQAATTLLPVVGPSLYLLARPSLEQE